MKHYLYIILGLALAPVACKSSDLSDNKTVEAVSEFAWKGKDNKRRNGGDKKHDHGDKKHDHGDKKHDHGDKKYDHDGKNRKDGKKGGDHKKGHDCDWDNPGQTMANGITLDKTMANGTRVVNGITRAKAAKSKKC